MVPMTCDVVHTYLPSMSIVEFYTKCPTIFFLGDCIVFKKVCKAFFLYVSSSRSKKEHSSIAIRHSNHVEDFVRGRSSSMVTTTTYSRTLFLVFGLCCTMYIPIVLFLYFFASELCFQVPLVPKLKISRVS